MLDTVLIWMGVAIFVLAGMVAWLGMWVSKLCMVIRGILSLVAAVTVGSDHKGEAEAYDALVKIVKANRGWL
jgi:hypothetical protein